jgi:hypothetical protein
LPVMESPLKVAPKGLVAGINFSREPGGNPS